MNNRFVAAVIADRLIVVNVYENIASFAHISLLLFFTLCVFDAVVRHEACGMRHKFQQPVFLVYNFILTIHT